MGSPTRQRGSQGLMSPMSTWRWCAPGDSKTTAATSPSGPTRWGGWRPAAAPGHAQLRRGGARPRDVGRQPRPGQRRRRLDLADVHGFTLSPSTPWNRSPSSPPAGTTISSPPSSSRLRTRTSTHRLLAVMRPTPAPHLRLARRLASHEDQLTLPKLSSSPAEPGRTGPAHPRMGQPHPTSPKSSDSSPPLPERQDRRPTRMSTPTVKTHLTHIFTKLNVGTAPHSQTWRTTTRQHNQDTRHEAADIANAARDRTGPGDVGALEGADVKRPSWTARAAKGAGLQRPRSCGCANPGGSARSGSAVLVRMVRLPERDGAARDRRSHRGPTVPRAGSVDDLLHLCVVVSEVGREHESANASAGRRRGRRPGATTTPRHRTCALGLVDAVAHESCGGNPVQGYEGEEPRSRRCSSPRGSLRARYRHDVQLRSR